MMFPLPPHCGFSCRVLPSLLWSLLKEGPQTSPKMRFERGERGHKVSPSPLNPCPPHPALPRGGQEGDPAAGLSPQGCPEAGRWTPRCTGASTSSSKWGKGAEGKNFCIPGCCNLPLGSAGTGKEQPQLWAPHLQLLQMQNWGGEGEPATLCPASSRRETSPGAQRGIPGALRVFGMGVPGAVLAGLRQQEQQQERLAEAPARGAAPGSSHRLVPRSLSPLLCLRCWDWGRGEAILASRQAESCGLCLAWRGAPAPAG